mmetsp:Transcript_89522/g.187026  ORF Transcript_89522/g.187026 Transcript_89522/m.187026 type:complete len:110 (+) Transcript_89522:79-408(+)
MGGRDRSSSSESGTPQWLKDRRKRAERGEITRAPIPDYGGKGGGGGGGKGGGGKGQTKPGDWTCPGCGMNVFASKDSCFKCGGRKPSGGGGGRDRGRDSRSRSRGRGRR